MDMNMPNDELYNLIKSQMNNGLTQEQLSNLFTRAQNEVSQEEDEKKVMLARECLINAILSYINALNLDDEITEEDVKTIEKQLLSIERAVKLIKSAGFSFPMGDSQGKTKTADEIIKEFLKDI